MSKDEQHVTPPEQKPKRRRKRRWLFWLLLLPVLFLIGLIGVFQIPSVQTWAAQKVADHLSETLDTKVAIDRLRLRWLDEIEMEGLYIEDLEQDTMMSVPSLYVDFNQPIRSLMDGQLRVDGFHLKDALINIRWLQDHPANNITMLFNKERREGPSPFEKPTNDLSTPPPSSKTPYVDTLSRPLTYWLKELILERTRLINYHEPKGKEEQFYVNYGELMNLALDLSTIDIQTERLFLDGPDVYIRHYPMAAPLYEVNNDDDFPFRLIAAEAEVRDGKFVLVKDHLRDPALNAPYLDFHDLNLSGIHIKGDSLYMEDWTFGGQLHDLSVKASNGFEVKHASAAQIDVTEKRARIRDLKLRTPRTAIDGDLTMSYKAYPDFIDFDDKVRFDLYLNDSQVGIQDLLQFVKGLRRNPFFVANQGKDIYADGRFVGTINNLNGRKLDLNLGGQMRVKGQIDIRDFNDPAQTRISFELDQLTTDMTTIRSLVPDLALPSQFDRLGHIELQGTFEGLLRDFIASGQLQTNIGATRFDMWMDFKNGVSSARYGGELDLIRFDLGSWTRDDRLGKTSLSARITEGFGLTKENVSGRLSTKIRSFEFLDYEYENADFTGYLKDGLVEGQFDIQDENIWLDWEGRLELGDSLDITAQGRLGHIDMMALNFTKRPFVLSTSFDLDIADVDENNVLGDGKFHELYIGSHVDSMVFLDSLTWSSLRSMDNYKQELRSAIADVDIEGSYKLFKLPNYLKDHFIKYNPEISTKLGMTSSAPVGAGAFMLSAYIKDTRGITNLLWPRLGPLRDIEIKGHFDTSVDYQLEVKAPMLKYDSTEVTGVFLYLSGEKAYSNMVLSHNGLEMPDLVMEPMTVFADLQEDTAFMTLNSYSFESLLDDINIEGRVYLHDNLWQLQLNNSDLTIFGERWATMSNNYLRFSPDYIEVSNLRLTHEDQQIELNSINDHKGLNLHLQDLDLSRINQVMTYDRLQFGGLISGDIALMEIKDLSTLMAKLRSSDLMINDDPFGDLALDITPQDGKSVVNLSLTEGTQSLGVDAVVELPNAKLGTQGSLSSKIKAVKMPASIIEYFVVNGVSNTTGIFDADITMSGPLDDPKMEGMLDIPASSFKVDILGTTYYAEAQRVAVSSDLIDLTGVEISDRLGNKGLISGGIVHHNLRNLGFAAQISSDEILVLETTEEDNDVYYGTCFGSVDAEFSGTVLEPMIYVRAQNSENSSFTINNDRRAEAGELDFVRFINKGEDSIAIQDQTMTGVDLKIDLSVTPDVEVSIIIDESTRDIIKATGSGDLRFAYSPAGEITLFGDYIIDRGDYLFTYSVGGVVPVNKPFSLKQGSKVIWTDDPYDAYLDIRADYRILASPFNLLADQGSALAQEAQARTDVILDLIIQGQMFSPSISFDIEMPELVGPLKSAVDIELARIESDPTLQQAQAAALIVFGDFTNNSVAGSSVGAFANTLGEWLSNQVSFYLTNIVSEVIRDWSFIDDIQVDIGVRLPSGEYNVAGTVSPEGTVSFASSELGLSTKVIMFDRRLELGLKGDFVNDATAVGGSNANVLNTDVELDYVLTPDGRWRLRVYTRQDQFYNSRRTRSGVGFNWRRSYDDRDEFDKRVRQLFSKEDGL